MISAVPALLALARCSNGNEQKQVEFLLSDREVPFQNEALLDVVTRKPSFLYGKLVSAQG